MKLHLASIGCVHGYILLQLFLLQLYSIGEPETEKQVS